MADTTQVDALAGLVNPNRGWQEGTAPAGGSSSSSSSSSSTTTSADPITAQLMAQLTAQNGIVSSSEKQVQDLLTGAQNTLKQGAADNASAVTTQYNRLEGYQADANRSTMTATLEGQRGFATNTALLTQINEQGQKSINDLEDRKQQLIMSGNADAASKISDLQVQQATMMLQNRQQVFSNLIALAGVNQQGQSIQLQKDSLIQNQAQFDKTMQKQMGDTALQYGIQLKPGDTIEDVINRAYPKASAEEQFKLDDMKASLALKGAQTSLAKAQAGAANAAAAASGRENRPMSETDFDNMMKGIAIYGGPEGSYAKSVFSTLAQTGNLGQLTKAVTAANKPRNYSDSDLNQKAIAMYSAGQSIGDAVEAIRTDPSIQNKQRAEDIARLYYGKPVIQSTTQLMVKDLTSGGGWAGIINPGVKNPLGTNF